MYTILMHSFMTITLILATYIGASCVVNILALNDKIKMDPVTLQKRVDLTPWRCVLLVILTIINLLLTYIVK